MSLSSLTDWYNRNKEAIETSYLHFLRIPSISTDPSYAQQVAIAANWVQRFLEDSSFETQLIQTKGHPLVFAQKYVDEKLPTLLLYGHYDVQPADPIQEWLHDPFEPYVKDGLVYARGAQDNKGQLIYVLHALRALQDLHQKLGCNLKILVEGEEEIGSPSLVHTLPAIEKMIAADHLLVVDGGLLSLDNPSISLGCRGIIAFEVAIQGSNRDLHSGSYGNVAYNPHRALIQLLNTLWTKEGSVAVAGFYDDVSPIEDLTPFTFPTFSLDGEEGLKAFWEEEGHPKEKAVMLRPSVEVHGISGGYTGKGSKTVIAKSASAKLSCRLISGQNPEKIYELLVKHLRAFCPKGVILSVEKHGLGKPFFTSPEVDIVKIAEAAYTEVFNRPCVKTLAGGSIPIAADVSAYAGADPIIIGMGLASDAIHAPNEHFSLDRLEKGFSVVARIIELLGSQYGDRNDRVQSKKYS